jgi:putative transposase
MEQIPKGAYTPELFRAVSKKRPPPGLMHHSDRGSQYCSHDYRKMLRQFGMRASMSRKGDCWDNAPMESFWGTLKNELVHHRKYFTCEQEIFYNRMRKQKRLGYLSPAAFTQKYYANKLAA